MTTYRDLNSTGDTTRWLRDEATGLVTNKVYADGKGPSYAYTPDGRLATRTWARGVVTTYAYDSSGALTNTVYSDGTPTISLVYNRAGRQIQAVDAAGVTTFLYDDFGSLTNETVIGVAGTNTIERFYDNYGRVQYNSDILLHYGENGLLESISNSVANAKYRYTVDNIDEGYHIALSNGIVVDRKLARDFVQGSVITNITSAVDGVIIENLVYKYDVLKRPISRNTDEFSYNDRNEVISAIIENISKTYGYDEIGNSSFFQANNLNQYSEYEYDPDGNLLSCGELTFGYDGENRLTTVSSNGVLLVTNVYDTKSRRVKKVTSEATMTFFYDDWNLIEERIAYTNGTITTIHYYWGKDLSGELQGAGGVSGLLYLTVSNSSSQLQLYIPCYDNNGNVTKYVDANGNIVASYTYDVFDNLISKSGSLADFFRHRFSTKYFDVKTELYYYGYRFYHPVLMRWLNRDPMEEDGGENLYEFCGNNGILEIDWLGCVRVSEVLGSFFNPLNFFPVLWIMPQDDPYTIVVRRWSVVQQQEDTIKRLISNDPETWKNNHITSKTWRPKMEYRFDSRVGYNELVKSPPGTDPATAEMEYKRYLIWGYESDKLAWAAIGSFRIAATVDYVNIKECRARANVWMYNEMSKKSFGRFAKRWYFRWLPMATQYMWWNWKMDFIFNKKGHYYDTPEVANRW
jgi:RHS repeat-associated protein